LGALVLKPECPNVNFQQQQFGTVGIKGVKDKKYKHHPRYQHSTRQVSTWGVL